MEPSIVELKMDPSIIESRLATVGLALPPLPAAQGDYLPWQLDGGLFVTSGQLSRDGDRVITGPAAGPADLPRAAEAARIALLRCLALYRQALDQGAGFRRVVSLRGFVASTPAFTAQTAVLDAASGLLVTVFGDAGRHVRSAIGVASLPSNGLVELELVIRCRD